MIDYYERNQEVDIVIGQIGRGVQGDWKIIPTHEEINRESLVSLVKRLKFYNLLGLVENYLILNLVHYVLMKTLCFVKSIPLSHELIYYAISNYYHSLYMAIMSKKVQSQINE